MLLYCEPYNCPLTARLHNAIASIYVSAPGVSYFLRPMLQLPPACMQVQEAPKSAAAQMASRKDKQGNPLEFLKLLFSLVSRW